MGGDLMNLWKVNWFSKSGSFFAAERVFSSIFMFGLCLIGFVFTFSIHKILKQNLIKYYFVSCKNPFDGLFKPGKTS